MEYDLERETYMAKRLKELSFSYDRVLYIGGMYHVENVLQLINQEKFPLLKHAERGLVEVCTLTSTRATPAVFTKSTVPST